MSERRNWLRRRFVVGCLLMAAGLAMLAGSVIAAAANPSVDSNFRIVGGLGIALGGAGLAFVIKYGRGLKDEEAARRVVADDLDERSILFRQRAGARAYWTSVPLVFGGLMWSSLAANGQLPNLEGDTLWNFLAAAVVIPFAVYAGSLIYDEWRS
jgi:hypothetical protein